MGKMIRSCFQSMLKLVNSLVAMVGLAMVLYALWMFRVWHQNVDDSDFLPPWFIYTFFGIGASLCVITCSGHIAAETANGCCLFLYMLFVFLLLMLEAAVTVDVFFNRDWEEDFPEDSTGKFDDLKVFIRKNFEMCKWIGLSIVAIQGLCVLFAMILKALGPHRQSSYESDDDYTPEGVPLLKNYVHQPSYVAKDPLYGSRKESWNIRVSK
ncbi:hypothetical protein ACET3Z_016540 [Daucus carota]